MHYFDSRFMRKILVVFITLTWCLFAHAADTLTIHHDESVLLNRRYFSQLEDTNGEMSPKDVFASKNFHNTRFVFPFINYADSVIWVRFVLLNKTAHPYVPVSLNMTVIDAFDLYAQSGNGQVIHLGSNDTSRADNEKRQVSRIINCPILPDSACTVYLRIKSSDAVAIPVRVQSIDNYLKNGLVQDIGIGVFLGIVGIMVIYNLLLFIILKDLSYFYYVLYIIFLGLTQWVGKGLGSEIFPVSKPLLNNYLLPLTRVCFWWSVLLFVNEFLQLKQNLPGKYFRKYYWLYVWVSLAPLMIILKRITLAYSIITIAAVINVIVLLLIGFYLYRKGFKPAKFFMMGWSLFLLTILVSIARSKGFIPYNDFTANAVLFSSAFELAMFSVALADRISFYRKQSSEVQAVALTIARENERLITGQNFALENKVKERTQELIESNKHLSVTIENLKSTQIQLIDTEKMASLGQLTAGIAHEINNPINFVSANVKPLRMDFIEVFNLVELYRELERNPSDEESLTKASNYAKEIDIEFIKNEILTLLEGIEEGATRTTEIVQSLRTFSRTDEGTLKQADINRSILTTLVLLRSTIPYGIEIQPVLDKLPMLNCYPGKINQVFVNLINNSIQAIKAKPVHQNEHILIKTKDHPDYVTIEIADTGIGMTDEVKQRIFDPFYTTKDIGEGTGLGLSIVFGIIEMHKGNIEVTSKPGEGTTFVVKLPKNLQ